MTTTMKKSRQVKHKLKQNIVLFKAKRREREKTTKKSIIIGNSIERIYLLYKQQSINMLFFFASNIVILINCVFTEYV